MSRTAEQPVRHKLTATSRSRRGFEERLLLRSPWLVAALRRLLARLPPGSRLRRVLLLRGAGLSLAAYSRGDLDVVLLSHHPDVEFVAPPEQSGLGMLGMRETYRGHEGYRELEAEWRGPWDAYGLVPLELVDCGDRLLVIAELTGHVRGSTVPVSQPVAILDILGDDGLIIREQRYSDHSEGYKAIGLLG